MDIIEEDIIDTDCSKEDIDSEDAIRMVVAAEDIDSDTIEVDSLSLDITIVDVHEEDIDFVRAYLVIKVGSCCMALDCCFHNQVVRQVVHQVVHRVVLVRNLDIVVVSVGFGFATVKHSFKTKLVCSLEVILVDFNSNLKMFLVDCLLQ